MRSQLNEWVISRGQGVRSEVRFAAEYLLRGERKSLRTERQTANLTTDEELKAFKQEVNQALDKRITELEG